VVLTFTRRILGTSWWVQAATKEIYATFGSQVCHPNVHVQAILHKLEVRDRTQSVTVAIQRQLISPLITPNGSSTR
jgi:hypothetical protein